MLPAIWRTGKDIGSESGVSRGFTIYIGLPSSKRQRQILSFPGSFVGSESHNPGIFDQVGGPVRTQS
ncbi:MAG TPA: hypothetical protein DGU45_01980 [Planctomycetes bacterium]|nr:hypothetical protein [Planctomycetota bacterium]